MARNLSQTQIDRKKKTGAALSRTTSTLGLGSLAVLGASAGTAKFGGKGVLRAVDASKAAKFHEGTKNKLFTAGVVGSGISGMNGYNNAAWQSAEARQRKAKTTVAKSAFEDGFYGCSYDTEIEKFEIPKIPKIPTTPFTQGVAHGMGGQTKAIPMAKNPGYKAGFGIGAAGGAVKDAAAKIPGQLKPIGQAAKNNWKPLTAGAAGGAVAGGMAMHKPKQQFGKHTDYDPEVKRMHRAKRYSQAAPYATGALATGAAYHGLKSVGERVERGGKKNLKPAYQLRFRGKRAGLAAGLAVGAVAAAKTGTNAHKRDSWQPYAKSLEGEVIKFGPKATYTDQHVWTHHNSDDGKSSTTTYHEPTHATSTHTGKSLVLRRDKYHVNTHPSEETFGPTTTAHSATIAAIGPKRANRKDARGIAHANRNKTPTIKFGGQKYQHIVNKSAGQSAFGVVHD